jgi:hypothetical protein
MSFKRITLVALATLFCMVLPSLASACCEARAPLGYPAFVPVGPVAPVGFANCFGCVAPAISGTPVAPAPIAVSGVVSPFGGPCCGWYGCGNCGWGWSGWSSWSGGVGVPFGPPSALYVVNQGPTYSGPGIVVPYKTYSPDTAYAPAADSGLCAPLLWPLRLPRSGLYEPALRACAAPAAGLLKRDGGGSPASRRPASAGLFTRWRARRCIAPAPRHSRH